MVYSAATRNLVSLEPNEEFLVQPYFTAIQGSISNMCSNEHSVGLDAEVERVIGYLEDILVSKFLSSVMTDLCEKARNSKSSRAGF